MSIISKTPFRSSDLETDPIVYGLRPEELRQGIYQLYNDKSLLITGTRGIGKSSFCYQLQKIIKGDDTLLKRCALDINMPKFITVNYICTPDDTIETIILSIISDLERQIEDCHEQYRISAKEFDISFFGIIKSKIALEKTETQKYSTLVSSFVEIIHKYAQIYVEPHINIALDELDQVKSEYNIAHFIIHTFRANFRIKFIVNEIRCFLERHFSAQKSTSRKLIFPLMPFYSNIRSLYAIIQIV